MPNDEEKIKLAESAARLKAFVQAHAPGRCKMFSQGEWCRCPLCDVDYLHFEARRSNEEAIPGVEYGIVGWKEKAEPMTAERLKEIVSIGESTESDDASEAIDDLIAEITRLKSENDELTEDVANLNRASDDMEREIASLKQLLADCPGIGLLNAYVTLATDNPRATDRDKELSAIVRTWLDARTKAIGDSQ